MIKNLLFKKNMRPKILCLGAHADDIEIGCGGTILRLIDEIPEAEFYWVVFSGTEIRKKEAYYSASIFLDSVKNKKICLETFRESFFPYVGGMIKEYFECLARTFSPDIIFTHYRKDAHQDHRLISSLTWNTFRNNFILEYEVPKYDGDIGKPNLYVGLSNSCVQKKLATLSKCFESQKEKDWFEEELFRSILRIRGMEIHSESKYAEAFYCRKIVF